MQQDKTHHPSRSQHTVSFSTPLISLSIPPLHDNAAPFAPLNATNRITETFTTSTTLPHHFVLCFESFPYWLLGLTPYNSLSIQICRFPSMKHFLSHASTHHWSLELLHCIMSHIGISKFQFTTLTSTTQTNAIYLISGSPSFLVTQENLITTYPTLFMSDLTKRFKIPVLSKLKLKMFHHTQFGGCTSTKLFLGYLNLQSYKPHLTTLRRTMGDYLSHSVFCKPLSSTHYGASSSLTDHHLMPVPLMLHIINMQTPRSPTGFGSRHLTLLEVCDMMGLPSWMKLPSLRLHHIPKIPIHIITGCLHSLQTLQLSKSSHSFLPNHTPWHPPHLPKLSKTSPVHWVPPLTWT